MTFPPVKREVDHMTEHNGERADLQAPPESAKNAASPGASGTEPASRPNGETLTDQFEAALCRLTDRTFEKNKPVEYAVQVKAAAKLKNVNVAAIRAEVRLRRGRGRATESVGCTPARNEVAAEPVDGAALLNELRATISRHLHLPHMADVVLTLWIIFTHALHAFRHSPRLVFRAPFENCGKTTGLKVLNKLCRRPHLTSHTTVAALFRRINDEQPTMLIDEADTYIDSPDYIGLLNSGHDRDGAVVDRCEKNAQGEFTVAKYNTWAPVAIARIGEIQPATLRSRCIIVNMVRAKPNEQPEPLRRTSVEAWTGLQARATRWAQQNHATLREAEPDITGLDNRAADNWRPLFAIADAAGGHWPKLARDAAAAFAEARKQSPAEELLAAIKRAFDRASDDALTSVALCKALASDEEFGDASHYEVTNEAWAGRKLNKELAPFVIKATQWRDPRTKTNSRGFKREQFADAFERYLPQVAK